MFENDRRHNSEPARKVRHSDCTPKDRHSERSEESPHSARSATNIRIAPITSALNLWSRLRARLQPCHNDVQKQGASAPEVRSITTFHRLTNLPFARLTHTAIVCCLAIVMLGAGDTSEKRYERIGHNMMCACGCSQILLECNHVGCPDSDRMIKELRAQVGGPTTGIASNGGPSGGTTGGAIGQGGSDAQILNWFVEKYGATVLAAPLRGGFDNVAWITPIALFLAAILGTALIIRIWKSRTQQRAPLKIKGMSAAGTDELRERIRRETEY